MTTSQTEASVVLLAELLLALFGACFCQLVSSIHHSTSLSLYLIPSYAPDITEVPEVLDGVIFLQVGSDGLQAEDWKGIRPRPLPLLFVLLLLVFLHQIDGCIRSIFLRHTTAAGSAFLLNPDVRLCSYRGTPPSADGGAAPLDLVLPPLSVDLLADLLQVSQGDGIAGLHFGHVLFQLQHFGLVLLESHRGQKNFRRQFQHWFYARQENNPLVTLSKSINFRIYYSLFCQVSSVFTTVLDTDFFMSEWGTRNERKKHVPPMCSWFYKHRYYWALNVWITSRMWLNCALSSK